MSEAERKLLQEVAIAVVSMYFNKDNEYFTDKAEEILAILRIVTADARATAGSDQMEQHIQYYHTEEVY